MTTTSSKPRTVTLKIHPHPALARFIASTADVPGIIAGTGAGKTVGAIVKFVNNMIRRPKEMWLAVEPTKAMFNRNLLQTTPDRISLLSYIRLFDPKAIYRKSDQAIYSQLGTVYLASATNPGAMEGAHVAGVLLDEAGLMSKLAFETALRRAAFKGGQVIIATTPYNRGWLFQDYFKVWQAGEPSYDIIQCPSTDNPRYPKDIMDRNRRTMSPARFHMMHEGGFERPEGMIYADQWDDRHLIDPFDIPADWWQGVGLDTGWNHPFAAVWLARDNDGVYYLTQSYRKAETLLDTHAQNLNSMTDGTNPTWMIDPSAKQQRNDLRKHGIAAQKANNDVLKGIDTVATLLATDRLKVFRNQSNSHWVDEIEGYIWNSKKDVFTDQPVKLNDDLMDATRYLLHTTETNAGMKLWT